MALYAKDSDLSQYDASIMTQGVDSFEADLTEASADILNLIKSVWWPLATGEAIDTFDEANLNTSILKKVTIYKAFYSYIFPKIAKFTENDVFVKKIEFYKGLFNDEWNVIKGLPLYDFDEDATFEDHERRGPIQRSLGRG